MEKKSLAPKIYLEVLGRVTFGKSRNLKTLLGMLRTLQRPTKEFKLDVISMKKVTFIVLLCIIDHMKGLL